MVYIMVYILFLQYRISGSNLKAIWFDDFTVDLVGGSCQSWVSSNIRYLPFGLQNEEIQDEIRVSLGGTPQKPPNCSIGQVVYSRSSLSLRFHGIGERDCSGSVFTPFPPGLCQSGDRPKFHNSTKGTEKLTIGHHQTPNWFITVYHGFLCFLHIISEFCKARSFLVVFVGDPHLINSTSTVNLTWLRRGFPRIHHTVEWSGPCNHNRWYRCAPPTSMPNSSDS